MPDPVLPPDVSLELGLKHQGLAEQAAQGDVVRLQISIISILIVAGSCPFIRISQFFVTFVTKKIWSIVNKEFIGYSIIIKRWIA